MKNITLVISMISLLTTGLCAQDYSLHFDGEENAVDLGNVLNDVKIPYTITAWINFSAQDHAQIIFHTDYPRPIPPVPDYFGFNLALGRFDAEGVVYRDSCTLVFSYSDGGGHSYGDRRSIVGDQLLSTNQWMHVACVVRDETDMNLYINGVEAAGTYSGSGDSIVHNDWHAWLGANFNGYLDEIWLYNRALSAEEIQYWMNNDQDPALAEDLIGCWQFDEGKGEIAYDGSDNNYDGFIYGATWSTNNPKNYIYTSVLIDSMLAVPGRTLLIPLRAHFPVDSMFSSMQASFNGFQDYLEFIGIYTEKSLIGTAGWEIEVNATDTVLSITAAGAQAISGDGILLWLKFRIPDSITVNDVPIQLKDILFNNGEIPVIKRDGNIHIVYCNFLVGDVDQNGEIQAEDAALILKYLVGIIDLDLCQIYNAYTSTDQTVSSLDAALILQYVAGSIDTLPFNTSSDLYNADASIFLPWTEYLYEPVVEIPLIITGSNIYSFKMQISYTPEYMTFQEIIWPDTMSNYLKEIKIDNGKIRIVTAGETAMNLEKDTLLTLRFAVNNPDFHETTLTVDYLFCNEMFQSFYVSLMQIYNWISAINNSFPQIPGKFELTQNYPNPFNPTTTISFTLPQEEFVTLTVYDVSGRFVTTLIDKRQTAGKHIVEWNANSSSSGIYFYKIQAGSKSLVKKMMHIK